MKHTLFITGAAGYVGAMLADQFSKRDDVLKIVALDKEPEPELLRGNSKIIWIMANTSDGSWRAMAAPHKPDIVIHTAWQIREMYGKKKRQWQWNVDGSCAVFDFAFSNDCVEKFVHFSTVSSYGAESTNTLEQRFTESDPFRENEYLYGIEKRVVEDRLKERFHAARKNKNTHVPKVFVVRPAAITGPRGRFMMKERFGLQAALSGKLSRSFIHRLVSFMVSVVPAPPLWLRQFIHEDDVADIIGMFSFKDVDGDYEVFNICPPGKPVLARDMAAAVGKRVLPISPYIVRVAFFIFWHLTRGRIPTSRGGWKFYSFPVAVDGSRITQKYGFSYRFGSLDAFRKTTGRYEYAVSVSERVS